MVVTNFAEVFDQRVMQCHQEIVPPRRAVVLLRVSQRAAMLVCQANTILPLGTTVAAARVLRTNGVARAVVASVAVLSTVRRVSVVFSIVSSLPIDDRSRHGHGVKLQSRRVIAEGHWDAMGIRYNASID